ncbi:MAG: hypothetical protein ACFFF9_13165 [Candidatus Thorarchaeota archaeon]
MAVDKGLWFSCIIPFIALNYHNYQPKQFTISDLEATYIFVLSLAIILPLGTLLAIAWNTRKGNLLLDFYDKGFSGVLAASLIIVTIVVIFGISTDTINILGFMTAFEGFYILVLGISLRNKLKEIEESSKLSNTQN